MGSKMYPPTIEQTLPAFYKDSSGACVITIPFGMNRTVSYNSIIGFALRLKTVQGGTIILNDMLSTTYNSSTNEVIFTINSDKINEGQFYKAQLAYVDKGSIIGYYSTLSVIKCVAKPTVEIVGFSNNSINLYSNSFIGKYTQNSIYGDTSEKVYSYEFIIYDKQYNILTTSGIQLHNSANDNALDSSTDEFIATMNLQPYETYYISYNVTTVNNLTISSPMYHMTVSETIDILNPISVIAKNIFKDGYILINFMTQNNLDYTGMYLLSRTDNNGLIWNEIERFESVNEINPLGLIQIKDTTIEQGKTYIYSLQEFNQYGVYTNRILSEPVLADYEDMFLSDKDRILKIRFNPKMNSFKNNIPEQKIETIGSKYPFIFKNGNVHYKEFPIGGLLSFQLDTAKMFLTPEEQLEGKVLDIDYHRKSTGLSSIEQFKDDKHLEKTNGIVRESINLTYDNIYSERYFKLKVLEWLNNGQPKLFRSPTEGLYIVRLLNVSLSPEEKLGRMIHNFTSTAYEIDEINFKTFSDLQLIKSINFNPTVLEKTEQVVLSDILNNNTEISLKSYLPKNLKGIRFKDFCSGDKIIINYDNSSENEEFIIGASHEFYLPEEDRTISDISIKINTKYINYDTFKRIIEYNQNTQVTTSFDSYSSVKIASLPCLGLPYHEKTFFFNPPKDQENQIRQLNNETEEMAIFNLSMLHNYQDLKKYLGYSLYLDEDNKYPKVLMKHIDQIIITKRQIIPIYQSPENSNLYLVNVFGHGFINDRNILQKEVKDGDRRDVEFNVDKKGELTFNEMIKKLNLDVFTFEQIMSNFQDDRYTILQKYIYNDSQNKWEPLENGYCIPYEGITDFTLNANDWQYKIDQQDFTAIPNNFSEKTTSTYVKTIDIDRFSNTIIPCISAGRGICVDIIPECQVFDYTFETTNPIIAEKKQNYLNNKTLQNLYEYLISLKEE